MKTTLTTMIFSALLGVCVDDSILITLSETQITLQSNSPERVKLNVIESMSAGNQFSVMKNIDIELCKEAK